jgi:hypothetical protein
MNVKLLTIKLRRKDEEGKKRIIKRGKVYAVKV